MINDPRQSGLWFDLQSLTEHCDAITYSNGMLLYRKKKVLSLHIKPFHQQWRLYGAVQRGARDSYSVSLGLQLKPDFHVESWSSLCGCPVASNCEHGVALMVSAAFQGLHLLGGGTFNQFYTPPTPENFEANYQRAQEKVQESARLAAESQLLNWLSALERADNALQNASHPVGAKIIHLQYLYLLSVGSKANHSELHLETTVSYPKVKGGWARPKVLHSQPRKDQPAYDQATTVDHEVLQMLRALPISNERYPDHLYNPKVTPTGQVGLLALQQAASTGRLLQDAGESTPGVAITWGPPQALRWEWHEITNLQSTESAWALRARLINADAKLCLNSPPLYLDATQGQCGLVLAEGMSAAQLEVLLKAPPLKSSALQKHQVALAQRLGALPLPPVVEQLATLKGIAPTAGLRLVPVPLEETLHKGLLQAQINFDYAGHCGWWENQGATVLVEGASGRLMLQRDIDTERDFITRLGDLGLHQQVADWFGIDGIKSQQAWLQWADDDFAVLREAGFTVTLDDPLTDWISRADSLDVSLQGDGDDGAEGDEGATSPWFDLSLGMEINGVRHNILPWLPELLAQVAASPLNPDTGMPDIPPFIYLRSPEKSGFVRLPTEGLKPWLAALLELVGDRSHDFNQESLKLTRMDALRTTAALGQGAVWQGAKALRTLLHQLTGQSEMPEVPVPASVQANLRPYQLQGLNWLQFLRKYGLGGILADDMGLGKTLQALAHIQVEKDAGRLTRPALIIAPVSLMGNWQREAARFCPGLRSLVLHGKDRHEVADSMAEHDIVITPYSLLERDRERWLQVQWHIVVLDEAQNIKNASTQAAQVASQLRAHQRLCLSGTPMENHLGEIWSLFHFLMPGFLGSQKRFTELFRTPIEKQGNPERMTQLRARVTPFMLRRTKALVAGELPPKVETVMRVELSGKQADLYETIRLGMEKTVREALETKGLAKSQITILDALLKLRQVCCDPQLLKLTAAKNVKTSAKLEQLMEMLPEMLAEGRRILLFSQFTSMLTLIEAQLAKRKISWVKLTGQSQKRDALIEQFTSGQVPLFLISLKAGGVGLNLPQADTVIHYDPWWNPAVENQATDRAHRIGQTQSVWVVKLVAQGTVEERILALQERKAALASSMYSGSVGRKQPLFNASDLEELLKPL